ncbi:putative transcription factor MYB-HB-like family [Lupinus albus]|uniref:Putative transcription factor MYB-HB-like family n=1 Tax=Lupinus albus TaxID=3870 RepID=A0A6A4QL06_LUPAL|nr:putative transcription factor MYB-HB-like family [Lupinus albus]
MMSKGETYKGRWKPEEDEILIAYVNKHGLNDIQNITGLNRSKESCKIRWTNYLNPRLNMVPFTPQEELQIINLHSRFGAKWNLIASEVSSN